MTTDAAALDRRDAQRADLTVAGTVSFAHGGNRTMREYQLHFQGAPRPCVACPVATA